MSQSTKEDTILANVLETMESNGIDPNDLAKICEAARASERSHASPLCPGCLERADAAQRSRSRHYPEPPPHDARCTDSTPRGRCRNRAHFDGRCFVHAGQLAKKRTAAGTTVTGPRTTK